MKQKRKRFKKITDENDPLKPGPTILMSLASMAVHLDEAFSDKGTNFDLIAAKANLDVPGVREWLKMMGDLALVPVKR